jgi:DNA-binding NarL/FixJ family response regulator
MRGADRSRVLVVDDHRTFTDLIALALRAEPDLEFVGAAHDAEQARRLVADEHPDIVLMDVQLGDTDGLELTAQLLRDHPDLVVVVLTAFGDGGVMRRAAIAGASALLPKDGSLPDLLSGLRGARRGGLVVHPQLLHTLVTTETPHSGPPGPDLTPRELSVLRLLAEGRTVATIAKELGISVHTCRGYVKVLLAKLDVHSQLEAVVVAVMHGLVDAPRRR